MNDWVILDPSQFKAAGVTSEPWDSHVGYSPYDFPTAVRIKWDEKSQTALLEFQYFTKEKTQESLLKDNVTALLGENTKRLYGLRIDAKTAGPVPLNAVNEILNSVKSAFQSLKQEATASVNAGRRYQLAENAIEQNSSYLFSGGFARA